MNERIRELAEQAAKEYHATLKPATHNIPNFKVQEIAEDAKTAGVAIIPDDFCEKFAELIVKECGSAISKGFNLWPNAVERVIKEHFGVK
jgi:hypothetical protein